MYYSLGVNGIGAHADPAHHGADADRRCWPRGTTGFPDDRRFHAYLAWMLGLEGLAIGVFSATDAFLFYVLFEATLIPIFFLIGSYGTGPRTYAAVKFLIYNLVGGLLMLASDHRPVLPVQPRRQAHRSCSAT